MSSKISKGIALLLFGILLCAGSGEINTMILYNFGDFPFAAIGVIVGPWGCIWCSLIWRSKRRGRHVCRRL